MIIAAWWEAILCSTFPTLLMRMWRIFYCDRGGKIIQKQYDYTYEIVTRSTLYDATSRHDGRNLKRGRWNWKITWPISQVNATMLHFRAFSHLKWRIIYISRRLLFYVNVMYKKICGLKLKINMYRAQYSRCYKNVPDRFLSDRSLVTDIFQQIIVYKHRIYDIIPLINHKV